MALESALPTGDNPASTGTPQEPTQSTPEVATDNQPEDARFSGKTPAELKAIIQEQDRMIGRQSNESVAKVRSLEERLNYIQQAIESRPVQQAPIEQRPQRQFDITEPERFINETVDEKLTRFGSFLAQRESQREQKETVASIAKGRKDAIKDNPRLYEGIESTVEQAIRMGLSQRIIDPQTAANPDTWEAVAQRLRLERGEYDRVVPQAKKPMAATQTEAPNGRRVGTADDDVELTDEDRMSAKQWGISEKEYVESVRKGRQMARKGELK